MIKAAVGKDLGPCRDRPRSKATESQAQVFLLEWLVWRGSPVVDDSYKTRRAESDKEDEIRSLEKLQMLVLILKMTSAQWQGF